MRRRKEGSGSTLSGTFFRFKQELYLCVSQAVYRCSVCYCVWSVFSISKCCFSAVLLLRNVAFITSWEIEIYSPKMQPIFGAGGAMRS